jgi:hypothetical protein
VCLQEVHDSLVSVEAEAERLFSAERSLMDADTQDRDRLYGRAQAVSRACCSVLGCCAAWKGGGCSTSMAKYSDHAARCCMPDE